MDEPAPTPPAPPDAEVSLPESLLTEVYAELRALAASYLAGRPGHSLRPTELVHEAYLKLVRASGRSDSIDRDRFMAIAALAMRQVLVDHARRRSTLRRGGGRHVDADVEAVANRTNDGAAELRLLEIDERLTLLADDHPRAARVAELYLFGGMTQEGVAMALGVSRGTVAKDWEQARSWLAQRRSAEDELEFERGPA